MTELETAPWLYEEEERFVLTTRSFYWPDQDQWVACLEFDGGVILGYGKSRDEAWEGLAKTMAELPQSWQEDPDEVLLQRWERLWRRSVVLARASSGPQGQLRLMGVGEQAHG